MCEIWKMIVDDGIQYDVGDQGSLRYTSTGKEVRWDLAPNGYKTLTDPIYGTRLLHRVIAKTFLGATDKPCTNHINGIKTDNRVENLEWVTYSENLIHAYQTGLRGGSRQKHKFKVTEEKLPIAEKLREEGCRYSEIYELTGLTYNTLMKYLGPSKFERADSEGLEQGMTLIREGNTLKDAAKIVGISTVTLRKYMGKRHQEGIDVKVNYAKLLLEAGLSHTEISMIVELSDVTLRTHFGDCPVYTAKMAKIADAMTHIDEMVKLRADGASLFELEAIYSISRTTMKKRAKDMGIDL